MSNQLVFIQEDKVVTDSTTVSEVFDKRHDNVLKDIREMDCSQEFWLLNFKESIRENRGKKYPMYYITQDGFTLLAMGYTGKKAMEFKEKYIKEFRRMEQQLKQPRVLSEKEQLVASMKLSLETSEELDQVKTKVSSLEERFDNELTLNHGQATSINHAIKKRVEKLHNEGVTGSLDTKRQMYSNIHSQLRRAFQAPTYREIRRTDFDEAIQWIGAWRPL